MTHMLTHSLPPPHKVLPHLPISHMSVIAVNERLITSLVLWAVKKSNTVHSLCVFSVSLSCALVYANFVLS